MKSKCEWNAFYASNSNPYGTEPSKFLKEFLPYLNKGKVIDAACGTGRNAAYLAENGFNVSALDFSEMALEKANKDNSNIEYKKQDLDFYLSPIMSFDSAICIDYRANQRLLDDLKKGLQIGGTLLLEAYTYEHLKKFSPNDMTIDECYKPFELARLLKAWNLLYYDERQIGETYKVRAIVKKPSF